MKTIITLVLALLLTTPLFAQDTIDSVEVREDVTIWALDTFKVLAFTETAEVTYRKGYLDGSDFVGIGDEITITFINVEDNPDTAEDETSTEFTQLINLINSNNNIKQSVTTAVKVKLGIN